MTQGTRAIFMVYHPKISTKAPALKEQAKPIIKTVISFIAWAFAFSTTVYVPVSNAVLPINRKFHPTPNIMSETANEKKCVPDKADVM